MNKTKKIALAAVSLAMAGTMVFGVVGCSSSSSKKKHTMGNFVITDDLKPKLDENGKLTYAATTTLNLNIGDQNDKTPRRIAYAASDLSGATKMPDNVSYASGDLKPVWAAMQQQLGLVITDGYGNLKSNAQITTPITNGTLAESAIISGSLQAIVENSDKFLNLTPYLDYMPNYKAFLDENPVTRYSLTGSTDGAMYAAPYFDGNDDIEKYSMVNYLWAYDILDNDLGTKFTQTTFTAQAKAKKAAWAEHEYGEGKVHSVESFMGTTGSYTIATTDPADDTKTVNVTVDYKAANDAAKDTATPLGKAISDAAGKAYTGTSGNIVDLQNFVIDETQGVVNGAQLATILREYIKVAYKIGSNAAYTKLSDVFCSASAAWDVDLLVAMSRCVVTCGPELDQSNNDAVNIFAIAGRQTTTQRRVDLMALAGELYGVRGLESRYEYTYIDAKGQLQDTRLNANAYEMLSKLSALKEEGLVYIGGLDKDSKATTVQTKPTNDGKDQTFMLHDYVQTQTSTGIKTKDLTKYNFGPIVTAVSKWDTNDDGTAETIMRFTESWRSVKNTGFCVPIEAVKDNPDKVSAVLALIDYMFSSDGQILLTYGTQSTNGNTVDANGWWYATKVTDKTVEQVADVAVEATNYAPAQYKMKASEKSKYFVYKGEVYTGFPYKDRQVPVVTDLNRDFYEGNEVTLSDGTKIKQAAGNIKISQVGSYTNYARYCVGSTLPVGNKDQGYEYQATAQCGINGANTVNTAILNGTIKHVKINLETGDTPWYLMVPTAFPLTAADQATLKSSDQTLVSGTWFLNDSGTTQLTNVFIDMLYYGLGSATAKPCGDDSVLSGSYSRYTTGASLVEAMEGGNKVLTQRRAVSRAGWSTLNDLYDLGYNI